MAEKFSDIVKSAVLTINNDLKKKANFERLLGYLKARDFLNAREADEIEDFQELFNTLNEKFKIRPARFVLEPLVRVLGDIRREDLKRLLQDASNGIVWEGYESKKPQTKKPQTAREVPVGRSTAPYPVMPPSEEVMGEDLSQCFFVVGEYVGIEWRRLGRQLKLSNVDFDQILVQHPRNLREQVQSMLKRWKNCNGKKATKASLVAALHKCGETLAAEEVEKTNTTE